MNNDLILIILTFIFGLYMAWNIGANDVSNAMGTSVGSKALTLKKAVILAGIFEFSGAFFMGGQVSSTIQQGIVNPEYFNLEPMTFVIGMMGSLLATGLWIHIASYLNLPISTTHAIIGAVIGFGLIVGGVPAIIWKHVFYITLSWITVPFISGLISFRIFDIIQKKVLYTLNPLDSAKKLAPYLAFFVLWIYTFNIFFKGNLNFNSFLPSLGLPLIAGLLFAIVTFLYIKKFPKLSPNKNTISPAHSQNIEKALKYLQKTKTSSAGVIYDKTTDLLKDLTKLSYDVKKEIKYSESTQQYIYVEKIFSFLQIISACLVAFAHGSNDVANAIGPLAAVLEVVKKNAIPKVFSVPTYILFLGGIGIVIGLSTWGWRVIETIGKKITELSPTRGFSAEIGTSITIIIASKLGLPISTTHALVGSVLGVGLARGLKSVNLKTVKDILLSWFVTIPLCAILSIAIFYLIKWTLFY